MQNVSIFKFEESFTVRTVIKDNEPWFVAKDVCDVLGLTNPSEALKSLDNDEKTTLRNSEGRAGAGAQCFNIINESGLYALVIRSNKPNARKFRKWITSEVLPAIRKTGRYAVPSVPVRESPCSEQPELPLSAPYFIPETTYFNVPVMSTRALAKLLGVPKYRIYNARANCRVKLAAGIDFFPVRTHQELRTGGCASVFGNLISNIDLFMESGAKKVSDYLRYGITTPPMLRSPWLLPPKPEQPEKPAQPPALNLPRRASGMIRQEYGYRLDDAFFEDDTVERALRELYKAGYDVGPALAKAEFMRATLRRVRSVHQIFGDVLKIESSHSITTAGSCSGWVGHPPAR